MTVADRLALAVCRLIDPATGTCATGEICQRCRRDSAAVAHKLAAILGEGHSLSSEDAATRVSLLIAEIPAPGTMLVAADEVPPVEQEITGNGSGASLPPFSNEPRVGEPLALWQVKMAAGCKPGGGFFNDWPAAEIEAVRDWLLPDEHLTPMLPGGYDETRTRWEERQRLRALLTQQAQVAREAGPH
jgi:hypothetical protein